MTTEQVLAAVEHHPEASEDEIADGLYATVKEALARGEDRLRVQTVLQLVYDELKSRGRTREWRAVGEVLASFDGWCAPSAAL